MKIIVAVDEQCAIGWSDGRLPWRSRTDMKRFAALTKTEPAQVVMGRKTWDSLPLRANGLRALPDRENFVLTRAVKVDDIISQGAVPIASLARGFFFDDAWLIGGATLYDAALDEGLVDEMHVTLVHLSTGADVVLKHDLYNWKLFILREQALGRSWLLSQEPTLVQVPADEPAISFMKLVRII